MKDLKMRQFWISFVFGAALFAVLECLAPYSVYIGWLFFANQLLLNAGVCVLLSAIVYKMLCRQSTADSFGTQGQAYEITEIRSNTPLIYDYTAVVTLESGEVLELHFDGIWPEPEAG